jgi:4-hydroxyphenylacetate 3-monooxygenase
VAPEDSIRDHAPRPFTGAEYIDSLRDGREAYIDGERIDPYLKRYVRGSNGVDYKERIKIMKLLWDAIGTEFGGRHELYERSYAGNHEDIRILALTGARRDGTMERINALVDRCMSEYGENGWVDDTWLDPEPRAQ